MDWTGSDRRTLVCFVWMGIKNQFLLQGVSSTVYCLPTVLEILYTNELG